MRGNERQWEAMRGLLITVYSRPWFDLQGRTRHTKFAVIKWCRWSNDDRMTMMIKWWSNDATDANDQDKPQMISDKGQCRWSRKLMPPSVISLALFVVESRDKLHQVKSDIANDGWPEKASEKMIMWWCSGKWRSELVGCLVGELAGTTGLDWTRLHSTGFNSAWYKYC